MTTTATTTRAANRLADAVIRSGRLAKGAVDWESEMDKSIAELELEEAIRQTYTRYARWVSASGTVGYHRAGCRELIPPVDGGNLSIIGQASVWTALRRVIGSPVFCPCLVLGYPVRVFERGLALCDGDLPGYVWVRDDAGKPYDQD
jgi:hypothetical protein